MLYNLYDIIRLLNIEPSYTLFAEVFPIDENTCVFRFADRKAKLRIYYKVEEFPMIIGGIIMWHGLLANIPAGYALCDGTNGTPNLRGRFVRGPATGVNPGGIGGKNNHDHAFTGDGHMHLMEGLHGPEDTDAPGFQFTASKAVTGTTDLGDGRPPFYELAFIMKL